MLTEEDIQKIIEANREVFPNKEDFESFKDEMKQSFSDLQTQVIIKMYEPRLFRIS